VLFTVKDPGRTYRPTASDAGRNRETTRELAAWIWSKRRVYGLLFAGLIAFGFYNYSVLGWYPVMLGRTFGASPSLISIWYGFAYLISGVSGALCSAPAVRYFRKRGSVDAPVIVLTITSAVALVPAVIGPLMPNLYLTVACFLLSMLMSALQTSMAFSSFVLITPSHRRGVIVAMFIMTMNLTGGSFASVVIGSLSDNVFGIENVRYSISLMAAVVVPVSLLCFMALRPAYREAAMREETRLDDLAEASTTS